jgi:glutathione S-transferase
MKLYIAPGPNSYRVRILMAEKGIELPLVELDYAKREHKAPEFLKLNSLGQVPVLELDDGTVITESVAICRYLEAVHPTPSLFGSNAASIGLIDMWNRRIENEVFATIGNVVLHTDEFFKERLIQVPEFAEAQRKMIPGKWA